MNVNTAPSELEIACALHDEIEALNQDAEEKSRVHPDVIKLLAESGLLVMTVPSEYGGTQRPVLDSLKTIEQLSYTDSSVGWSAMIYSKTAHLGAALPKRWGSDIYRVKRHADAFLSPITAGAAAPTGEGKLVDGGIVVSGRWSWGSGTEHADWIVGGTLIEDDQGEYLTLANGSPAVHLVYFPKEDVQLLQNWNTSGLRGTGSGDFVVKDVFVPDGRWMTVGVPPKDVDGPLYQFPAFGYFAAAVASVPLGIARRALDDFSEMARSKVPYGKTSQIKTSPITQLAYGQAEALVSGARHYLWGVVGDVWSKVLSNEDVTSDDKRQLRLAASQSVSMCTQAVDSLYNEGGGTSLHLSSPLQKHFRDIHAATQHRMVGREFLRMAAGVKLDGETAAQL